MRLVFMGTPAFAATCLERLSRTEHEIVGVYTKVDMPKNRGHQLAISEVKALALQKGYPVFQPASLRDDAVYEQLCALRPELIVVVAYGKLLPQQILDLPRCGCINIHGSLLPALRGAAPVQWAVLKGLPETGVTAMYLSAGMDEGDVIASRRYPIDPRMSAGQLMDALAEEGAALLCETVDRIEQGTATRTPQEPTLASYAPMLSKALSPIEWTQTARQIVCQIHGLNPWPVATAELAGTLFKIYDAEPVAAPCEGAAGTPVALDRRGLTVLCGDGAIRITELQAQGGKRMPAPDYFRGHPIEL